MLWRGSAKRQRGEASAPWRRLQEADVLPGENELSTVTVRKRLQNDGVDNREHRRARPDAESEREHHRRCEPRILSNIPKGVSYLRHENFPDAPAPHTANLFFGNAGVSKRTAGGVRGFLRRYAAFYQ